MARIFLVFRRRLLTLAETTAGLSATGAAGFWFWTRKCTFEGFEPESDNLFHHPILKQTNPWNKPDSTICVYAECYFPSFRQRCLRMLEREEVSWLRHFALECGEDMHSADWRQGFGIQRRIMTLFKDEMNKNDLWTKEELLNSKYEPGTFVTHHFAMLDKSPQSLVFRACFSPRQNPPTPLAMDTLYELRAELNEEEQAVVFRMKSITFDGTEDASEKPDPFGGIGGWLHRQYVVILIEAAVGNCMQ